MGAFPAEHVLAERVHDAEFGSSITAQTNVTATTGETYGRRNAARTSVRPRNGRGR